MLNFLRKLRLSQIKRQKISQYLVYAIGEIILVVIGILIAINVNNRNENRIQEKNLLEIYKTIKKDLIQDTLVLSSFIPAYEELGRYMDELINNEQDISRLDTITPKNLKACVLCNSLITSYSPFTPQERGYLLLIKEGNSQKETIDSLSQEIAQFYKAHFANLDEMLDLVQRYTEQNLTYFEKQSWFIDWSQQKINKEWMQYFLSDPLYKNKVASFKMVAINNYLGSLKAYNHNAKIVIQMIDEALSNS